MNFYLRNKSQMCLDRKY